MADTQSIILRKADPFVLDSTVENLEHISGNSNPTYPLPLGSNPGGNTEEDRPYLETSFNKLGSNKYRNPWKPVDTSSGESDILEFEHTANEVWDAYRQLYYGHDAIGSVFVRRKGSDVRTGTPSKAKKGGALEALFGIQKKCVSDESGDEISRWDSVHTVTIEVPNFEDGTCEYKIKSAVWCRYKPEDVGDVPSAEKPKKAAPSPSKKAGRRNSKLDVSRLEIYDRAANSWDSHDKKQKSDRAALAKGGKPLPPVPAVVTSSAMYTKDTAKVLKLQVSKKQPKAIPVAGHIQNIGTLLEKIETDFRSKLERVDAPKCVEVLESMYRPSLSPGLKLPSSSKGSSMIAKRGGHATGMGVGRGLIGEIASKAKAKGLGSTESGGGSRNKAMESILSNEKKKLMEPVSPGALKRPNLRKAVSNRKISPKSEEESNTSKPPGAGFLKRTNLRKATSVRGFDASKPSPTPEFMNFRSKLKSTAAK